MLRVMRSTAVWSHAVAVAVVAASAAVAGAQQARRPSKLPGGGTMTATVGAALGKCSTADKVMATGLTVDPAAPKFGDKVTVTLTARNLCDLALNVPWEIVGPASVVLGSGVQQNVPAGGSFVVNAAWTAMSGAAAALGSVDPKNSFTESAANRTNNNQQVQFSVATRLVEEVLNYHKAKLAGANFAHNLGPNTAGCMKIGQFDPGALNSVSFVVECLGVAKATPEAFSNFQLKNGWTVKRVEDPSFSNAKRKPTRGTDWQWVGNPPEKGSDSPRMQMLIEPTFVVGGPQLHMFIKVIIEGPWGTCPYRVMSGPC